MGTIAAGPAMAATPLDCDGANTLTSPADSAGDIQNLLDLNTPIVCLSGTFALASPLSFDHDVTFFGLTDAELDGENLTQILNGTDGAALTIQNLSFVNGAATRGGAIFIDGELDVENSTFTSNTAVEDGGAIYVDGTTGDPSVEIIDSVFTGNEAGDGPSAYSGGAIYVADAGAFTIIGSTFTGNSSDLFGGAVYGFQVVVDESTFTTNAAGASGGGLYALQTAIFESTFTANEAFTGGAVIGGGYAAAFGSTFADNVSEDFGGALASYGEVQVLNSTFAQNSAGTVGGAIAAEYGQIGFTTFLANQAADADLGDQSNSIFVDSEVDGTEIAGNIFAGATATAHLGGTPGAYADLGGNLFTTSKAIETVLTAPATSSLFAQSITAIFGPAASLADNGGSTDTVALVAGSPAIDAVPPFAFSAVLASAGADLQASATLQSAVDSIDFDQRDVERTGLSDAGAFEFGDAELAATGADASASGWLAGFAALLLGSGAVVALSGRRRVGVGQSRR